MFAHNYISAIASFDFIAKTLYVLNKSIWISDIWNRGVAQWVRAFATQAEGCCSNPSRDRP